MLRRLRLRRSFWAALAIGIVAVPALFGGVAAAPTDMNSHNLLPPPELDPRQGPPPDPAEAIATLLLAQSRAIADLAPTELRMIVVSAALRHRVDPRLVAAIITVETEWDPLAVGGHGELGLMQILPSTGAALAELKGLTSYNLADSATNVELGAYYLSTLVHMYENPLMAVAAYNGGPSMADTWETNVYVRKVLKHYDALHWKQPPASPLAVHLSAS